MGTVYVDAAIGDDLRRERLYAGELFAYSPNPGSAGLCGVAREMSEEAFAPHDPPIAQDSMTAEDYATILADLKPRFIHDPRCKQFIADLLGGLGCDHGRAHLKDQLDRAGTSIVLNIAEGAGEFSLPDKQRFYRIAKRSATETSAMKVYGLRQWFIGSAESLAQKGYKINLQKKFLSRGWLIWER